MGRDGTTCKCCCRRFHSRPRDDVPPPWLKDVDDLFVHAGGGPALDEDGLRRCLGYDDVDGGMLGRCLQYSDAARPAAPHPPRQELFFNLVDLHRILFSYDLNPAIRHHQHHDMTLPLSHYYIYSSHGDERIIRALKMGVRAIELAMRPNSNQDDIEIIHQGWFTQRNILRIYTWDNYDAFLGWVNGAQMVALNMHDERDLWLMHGFYRANGGCGYVRKPDFLTQTEPERDLWLMHGFYRATQTEPQVFDPRKRQPVKTTLKVKVYMGDGWLDFKHAHTSFIPDLWTSVGIDGVPDDTTAMKNTKATENTWVPVWEDEFSFPLTVPEIALLQVEVHQYDVSDKDVFGGQTVLPVSELRPGIRAVALFDRQGNRLDNARLLMRFEFV